MQSKTSSIHQRTNFSHTVLKYYFVRNFRHLGVVVVYALLILEREKQIDQ